MAHIDGEHVHSIWKLSIELIKIKVTWILKNRPKLSLSLFLRRYTKFQNTILTHKFLHRIDQVKMTWILRDSHSKHFCRTILRWRPYKVIPVLSWSVRIAQHGFWGTDTSFPQSSLVGQSLRPHLFPPSLLCSTDQVRKTCIIRDWLTLALSNPSP